MTDRPTVSWSDDRGRHEIDAKAFVARLTETNPDGWDVSDEDDTGMKILSWG